MIILQKVIAILMAGYALAFPVVEASEAEPFSQEQIETYESLVTFSEEIVVNQPIILPDTVPLEGKYQVFAQKLCYKYHISWSLVLAVMESESNFEWEEEGKDIGYMQIRECNWYRYELDAHNPYDNIEIGIRMLAELKDKYMEFDKIIMAYKGGETAMLRWVDEGLTLDCCDTLALRQDYWGSELDDTRCY